MTKRNATPPSYLTRDGRRLWLKLYRTHVFDLPASQLLLTQLCQAVDRAGACREALDGQPLTIKDKFGTEKVHPLVVEERAAREQIMRLTRTLRIHVEVPGDA